MVTITIYSSGAHYGPLKPPATLRYDLRNITNPPKKLRDTLDGRSKKLREHLLNEQDFADLLESIISDILKEVDKLKNAIGGGEVPDGDAVAVTQHAQSSEADIEALGSSGNTDVGDMKISSSKESTFQPPIEESFETSSSSRDEPIITVNCFCHLGRHRSASMVEELGRIKWPKEFQVKVFHRDIDRSRKKSGKQRWIGKSSRMQQDNDDE
ncbi:hypothetical protein TWF694_007831 [Orbilia ellipsospora]|uniref:RapZ C-terminal domain-containing protein n=1 Tax=Orbilia ellipsospora TaxID=2528407 RepID=A0AAV9XIW3_9PEZI